MGNCRKQIILCDGAECNNLAGEIIAEHFQKALEENDLKKEIKLVRSSCFGICGLGPIVKIIPENTYYVHVKPEDVNEIVLEHIIKGKTVERLLVKPDSEEKHPDNPNGEKHFQRQVRIALRNCGVIDPENINDAIAHGAYFALGKVLTTLSPAETIELIKKSGLRGRGGAGFPTGLKWELASRSKGDIKYVVCNADEGDPGAFMDRSILEGDPHAVVEAMAICGYCIGSQKGFVYIRAEYPLAIERLKKAIAQARDCGLLGNAILNTPFSFDIELKYGAGAFVCGEETALLHSMEGLRGEPTLKPPFPAEAGYLGKPTNVNNVETYANIPPIVLNGADWFSSIGTEKSKGTKVFALAGKINNVGLVEVPMGTTLRNVIFNIGGGIREGRQFKAIQTGGPSGGCLTKKHLDLPIDYESLTANGSMMGSGGMIVMDEDDCMVAMAKYYLDFTVEESCGKCSPCRIGNKRLYELLHKITEGKGTMDDIGLLRNLGNVIKDTSLCQLGGSSPNPVLSTLDNFYDEYTAHIIDHRCPAGQCKALIHYYIDTELCVGCTACARNCPVNAISGERKQLHVIDQSICIKCGACEEKCKFNAVIVK
jgi:NADP-reducing hydrogenase subunit HndC